MDTFFDYETAAREAGVSDDDLQKICALVRQDFPHDDMLFELHVLRICLAIRGGRTTLARVLQEPFPAAA